MSPKEECYKKYFLQLNYIQHVRSTRVSYVICNEIRSHVILKCVVEALTAQFKNLKKKKKNQN